MASNNYCKYFASGTCRYGANCRYSHSIPNSGAQPSDNSKAKPGSWDALSAATLEEDFNNWPAFPFSDYGPVRQQQCIVTDLDISPEELRIMLIDDLSATGHMNNFKQNLQLELQKASSVVASVRSNDPNSIILKLKAEKIDHERIAQNFPRFYQPPPTQNTSAKYNFVNPNYVPGSNNPFDILKRPENQWGANVPKFAPITTDRMFGANTQLAQQGLVKSLAHGVQPGVNLLTSGAHLTQPINFGFNSNDQVGVVPPQTGFGVFKNTNQQKPSAFNTNNSSSGFSGFNNTSFAPTGFNTSTPAPVNTGFNNAPAASASTGTNPFMSSGFNVSTPAPVNTGFNNAPNTPGPTGLNNPISSGFNIPTPASAPSGVTSTASGSNPPPPTNQDSATLIGFSFKKAVEDAKLIHVPSDATPVNPASSFPFEKAAGEANKSVVAPTPAPSTLDAKPVDESVKPSPTAQPVSGISSEEAQAKLLSGFSFKKALEDSLKKEDKIVSEPEPTTSIDKPAESSSGADIASKPAQSSSGFNIPSKPADSSGGFKFPASKNSFPFRPELKKEVELDDSKPIKDEKETVTTKPIPTQVNQGQNTIFPPISQVHKNLTHSEKVLIKNYESFYDYSAELPSLTIDDLTAQLDTLLRSLPYNPNSFQSESEDTIILPKPFQPKPSQSKDHKSIALSKLPIDNSILNPQFLANPQCYPKKEVLQQWEIEAFEEELFTLGKIPVIPPPVDFLLFE